VIRKLYNQYSNKGNVPLPRMYGEIDVHYEYLTNSVNAG
jgi:hypothetical protein